jgi:hypothetical protein
MGNDSGEGGCSIGNELSTLNQLTLSNRLTFTQFLDPVSTDALLLQSGDYLLLQNDGHLLLEA